MSQPDESAYLKRIAAKSVRRRTKIRDVLVAVIPYAVLVVVILLAGAAIVMYLASRAQR